MTLPNYVSSSDDILKHASKLLKAELPVSLRLIGRQKMVDFYLLQRWTCRVIGLMYFCTADMIFFSYILCLHNKFTKLRKKILIFFAKGGNVSGTLESASSCLERYVLLGVET